MTEREWEICEQCDSLLSLLQSRSLAGQRKLRLFGAACCLYNLDLFIDTRLHLGLRVAEKLADGPVDEREYVEVQLAAFDVVSGELDETNGRPFGLPFDSAQKKTGHNPLTVAHSVRKL